MSSFLSRWFSAPDSPESTDRRNVTKVYNTFSDATSLSPIPTSPSNPFSPSIVQNGSTAGSSGTSHSIGIPIFETYNTTSGANFPVLTGSTELQDIGTSSADAMRCCKRCRRLYKNEENNEWACKYHRGKFKASAAFTSMGSLKRWTCCYKESELSEGCTAGPHEEDHRVTGILNSFNTTAPSEAKEPEPSSPQPPKTTEITVIQPTEKQKRKGQLQHTVQKEDTLQKLAIQYNVSIPAIKKANKLFSDQIFGKKTLIIPEEMDG